MFSLLVGVGRHVEELRDGAVWEGELQVVRVDGGAVGDHHDVVGGGQRAAGWQFNII